MQQLAYGISLFCGMFGAAFLIAGLGTFLGPDQKEAAELRALGDAPRERGLDPWQARAFVHAQYQTTSRFARHWRERQAARIFIFLAIVFLLFAVLASITADHLTAKPSNKAIELTATRRTTSFSMDSTSPPTALRALGRGSSSCSH
jgi:hypothetical protein